MPPPFAADAILEEYRVAPDTLKTDIRKGCLLYFVGAFVLSRGHRYVSADAVRAYVELGTFPLADGRVRLSCSGETEARIYESNERRDFAELAAVDCPIVIAAGGDVAHCYALGGAMGAACAMGLGLALAQPTRRV